MARQEYFVMVDEEVKPATLAEWCDWFKDIDNRRVENTMVGDVQVSTVCLGMDHGWGDGPPILFETMVFGMPGDDSQEYQWRYATLQEAKNAHRSIVAAIREGRDPNEAYLR